MLRWIISIFLCAALFGASPQYVAEDDSTLTTTARNLTLNYASRTIQLVGAKIYCEAGCVVTQKRDSTASSGTAVTPVGVNTGTRTGTATASKQATIAGGTTIANDVVSAGSTMTFDLSGFILDGVTTSYTIDIASVSTRVIITLYYKED